MHQLRRVADVKVCHAFPHYDGQVLTCMHAIDAVIVGLFEK
jgi:hypothetical protein